MAALRKRCDSQLEKRWLDLVDELMLRPPSDAQFLIESCHTCPDFYYREHNAAIYIDGPPHDTPDQIREDEAITHRLMEMGYIVIRFHHMADWKEIFRRHPDIFGIPSRPEEQEQELAVLTLRFAKPDGTTFTDNERKLCRKEGDAALESFIGAIACPGGVRLGIRFAGDGTSSYWHEIAIIAVGFIAGIPFALHLVGEALEAGGDLTFLLATSMSVSGSSLKSVAWRLSPKDPKASPSRRPGCFGLKDQLDRRCKRCRDCGFLKDCAKMAEVFKQ